MNYQDIINSDVSKWFSYAPLDTQYAKYAESNPSVLAAGHKIQDVYCAFADAHFMFKNANLDNYGDIIERKPTSTLYAKTQFLTSALLNYGLCLDLLWQVVWTYIQPASLSYLINNKYELLEKECTYDNLICQLNCAVSQGVREAQEIRQLVTEMNADSAIVDIRKIYNYIKHRGTIHFVGVGENFTHLSGKVNGKSIPILARKSYTKEEIENLLYKYHFAFINHFNTLIDLIVPEDYFDTQIPAESFITGMLQIHDALE